MKLLFDECVPSPLIAYFPESFEICTVQQMGWIGNKNGDLLQLAATNGFKALVTTDQGIEYQQNPDNMPIAVVVITASRTRVQELRPLVPRVVDLITGNLRKHVYHVTDQKT